MKTKLCKMKTGFEQLYFQWILGGLPSWISIAHQNRIGLDICTGFSNVH